MSESFSMFRSAIQHLVTLNDKQWSKLASILEAVQFDKEDQLLREGQYSKGTYFLTEGALRVLKRKEGKEIHTAFYFEGDFVRDVVSMMEDTPSTVNIVALESGTAVYIPKSKMIALYQEDPAFQEIGRKLLEQMVLTEQKYVALFTEFQPKERYQFLLEHHPEIIQRVPGQYIATFIGVARETLSRIRKRL